MPQHVYLKKKYLCSLVLGIALAVPLTNTLAGTVTDTLNVSALVSSECALTINNLAFGTYTGAVINTTANIGVNCSTGLPYTIALSKGSAPSYSPRQMFNVNAPLDYNLYTTNTYTTIWGDGTNGTQTISATGTGANVNTPAFGRITANQVVATGNYKDQVIVTVTY